MTYVSQLDVPWLLQAIYGIGIRLELAHAYSNVEPSVQLDTNRFGDFGGVAVSYAAPARRRLPPAPQKCNVIAFGEQFHDGVL